jgi:hypothetical protein
LLFDGFFIVLCKVIPFYRNGGIASTAGEKALQKPPGVFEDKVL